jgi:hypothetical protein
MLNVVVAQFFGDAIMAIVAGASYKITKRRQNRTLDLNTEEHGG